MGKLPAEFRYLLLQLCLGCLIRIAHVEQEFLFDFCGHLQGEVGELGMLVHIVLHSRGVLECALAFGGLDKRAQGL
jgi:hypothetical protein